MYVKWPGGGVFLPLTVSQ